MRFDFGDVGIVCEMSVKDKAGTGECGVVEWGVGECHVGGCGVSECGVGQCGVGQCASSRRVRPWEPVVQWLALFVFLVFLSFGIVWNVFGNQWSGAGERNLPEMISPCYTLQASSRLAMRTCMKWVTAATSSSCDVSLV